MNLTATARPRVLRLQSGSSLVSARVFEDTFTRYLGAAVSLSRGNLYDFLDHILGPPDTGLPPGESATRLRAVDRVADILSVDHRGFHDLPRLLELRRRGGSRLRVMIVAHSPAACPLDWAMIAPWLRGGDLIVAPTRSAAEVIVTTVPALGRHVRTIGHPVPGLRSLRSLRRRHRLLYLGRLVTGKALGPLVDGIALAARQRHDLTLVLAGPVGVPALEPAGSDSSDVRALKERIRRLGLSDRVSFTGEVGDARKVRLLESADALVNLSVTVEESFGKSVVEGLAAGTPALVTRWDGLPEVVGGAGEVVPVELGVGGARVTPTEIADGIDRLLSRRPSADQCREKASDYAPERVTRDYVDTMTAAMDERADHDAGPAQDHVVAAMAAGLLAGVAPLTQYTYSEVADALAAEGDARRASRNETAGRSTLGGVIRSVVFQALRPRMERLLAGKNALPSRPARRPCGGGSIVVRAAECVESDDEDSSRLACLQLLGRLQEWAAVARGLRRLAEDGLQTSGMRYLEIELLVHGGRPREAFDLAQADLTCPGPDSEAWFRLEQLARTALEAHVPEMALPLLRQWTDAFPDEPSSAGVWLARAECARGCGSVGELIACLGMARRLRGDGSRVTAPADDPDESPVEA